LLIALMSIADEVILDVYNADEEWCRMGEIDLAINRIIESLTWCNSINSWAIHDVVRQFQTDDWPRIDSVAYKNMARDTNRTPLGSFCDIYSRGEVVTRVTFRVMECEYNRDVPEQTSGDVYLEFTRAFELATQRVIQLVGQPLFTGTDDSPDFPSHLEVEMASRWRQRTCHYTIGMGQEADYTPLTLYAIIEPLSLDS
jgi:hypothetical protein